MPILKSKLPSYRLHRPSGQAVVTLGGQDHYLGAHGSPESRREYERLIAEWLANHKQSLPSGNNDATRAPCIAALIVAYVKFAEGYYLKHGKPTSMIHRIRVALRILLDRYGSEFPSEFGPLKLKAVRQVLVDQGLCVTTVNEYVSIIRRMFRWGVANEMSPAGVHQALQAVTGLRAGRSEARNPEPVRPVAEAMVDAILPLVSLEVAALVRLQLLTGMRPGEVCIMRGCDLDTTGRVWIYHPGSYKTEHIGKDRTIFLGPRAQAVVQPFLKTDLQAYLFSASKAEDRRNTERRCRGTSALKTKRLTRRHRNRPPGDRYHVTSYRRAIQRACEQAFPPPATLARHPNENKAQWRQRLSDGQKLELAQWRHAHAWHPNQLRHNAATTLRKVFGLEQARAVLGHSSPEVTEIYAELDQAQAADIMLRVG